MAGQQETRLTFNKMISKAFHASTLTHIIRERDLIKLKKAIYSQMFQLGALISTDGKDLIKTIEDASTGGLKALYIDKKQLEVIYNKIDDLAKDPNLKLTVEQIKDKIVSTIINLQTSTKQIIIHKLGEKRIAALIAFNKEHAIKPKGLDKIKEWGRKVSEGIAYSKKYGKFKTIKDFSKKIGKEVGVSSLARMVGFGAVFHGARAIWGKIPILLGPVPIRNVNYVEVARSGKVLKFRATGSAFLARQEGGDQSDAIKIEGIFYKVEFGIMFFIWALFLYGQSKVKEFKNIIELQETITSITKMRKMNDILTSDTSLQRPSYEYHRTFPFVSKHFIIPNCYIETISIEDKLPLKDVIKYTILLRTYKKPIDVIRYVKQADENISIFGFPKKTIASEICQYSLTTAWRLFNANGWIADELEWRIGSAKKPGVLDTYYDVDATSIATVAYLSLMGGVV
ncbi:hypothetical protein LCGC14_1210360 [marine sediment metagenome]|uniref:Uncharacterized protein n=1 Tax=marine sediment metagenome TaxID=412755 RepID=A0A0F9LE39_9ZZZZ